MPRDHGDADVDLTIPAPLMAPGGGGLVPFQPTITETGEFRAYSYEDELARIRQIWASAATGARAARPSARAFKTRSLRRFS